MRTPLPINLDALLRQRAIEGERVEYKAGWNPQTALHTVCAFANDFHNLGGGYLVIGVEEVNGRPVLPPKGIDPNRRYRNRRIGEFLKELDLTEGRATGVPKILRAMANNGSPQPEFQSDEDRTYFLIRLPIHERAKRDTGQVTPHVTPQVTPHVTPQVERLLAVAAGELLRDELQERLEIADRKYFRIEFLAPAMEAGLLEMTLPDKPRSSKQRYRLTDLGRSLQAELAAARHEDTPE